MKHRRSRRFCVLVASAAWLALSGYASAQARLRHFDIPAQDAASALQAFARQSDVQLLFPYDAAAGRSAPRVKGHLSEADVLAVLAEAAGLAVTSNDGRVIILSSRPADASPTPAMLIPQPPLFVPPLVVTGTNIRGALPVGQNVITIGRRDIERTAASSVQQLLATLAPQINGFGSAGQNAGSFEPRLRSLGGSSSASTLVLMDGHRITPGGNTATFAPDPNIVPTGAVERIEILPDGASALYGSDAVAGVINIITRRNYKGLEVSGQVGFGDSYATRQLDIVFGRAWNNGSAMATYDHSYRSDLFAGDRDFVSGNQSSVGPGATGAGGANFNTFACSPATFVPAAGLPGAGLVFQAPYAAGAGIENSQPVTGLCSTARLVDLLPGEEANRAFFSLRQQLGQRVEVSANLTYSKRQTKTSISRGSIFNVAVFGPGSAPGAGQISPFFQAPPGANRGTISFNFDDLFGPGARSLVTQESVLANFAVDADMGRDWRGSFAATIGRPHFVTVSDGVVCQTCAYLALNGTNLANADPSTSVAASTLVTRVPLTAANALDVWTQGGGATSAAVRAQLLDNQSYVAITRPLSDMVMKFDGPLFRLPAGVVKAALGGEYYIGSGSSVTVSANPSGLTNFSSVSTDFNIRERKITSAFLELALPLVSEDMNVPFVRRLTFDASGRVDHYNDIVKGENVTKNPKVGVDWEVVRGTLLRASYGTSFTAPQIGHNQLLGANSNVRDYFGVGSAAFTLPQGYLNSQFLGCPAIGSCTITAASGKNGIITFGGNPDLVPQKGRSWSVGVDFRPRGALAGFHASATYWGAKYRGMITNLTNVTMAAATPGLEDLLIIHPTAEQIAKSTSGRIQTTPITLPIDFINNTVQYNMFNLRGRGADFDVGYDFDTRAGTFGVGVIAETKLQFDKQTAAAPWTRALNIANTTNTASPLAFAGRGALSWRRGRSSADLFANYVADYWLVDGTAPFATRPCPSNVTSNNLGCQHVDGNLTFDLHAMQQFTPRALAGIQLHLYVRNVFDTPPPFINTPDSITGNGSLNTWSNPIGRLVSVGLRKSW